MSASSKITSAQMDPSSSAPPESKTTTNTALTSSAQAAIARSQASSSKPMLQGKNMSASNLSSAQTPPSAAGAPVSNPVPVATAAKAGPVTTSNATPVPTPGPVSNSVPVVTASKTAPAMTSNATPVPTLAPVSNSAPVLTTTTTGPVPVAPKISDVKAVTDSAKLSVVDEIKELTQEIKLRQAMLKVEQAKWFRKKDLSNEKQLISDLAAKLVGLLLKIFKGHQELNKVRCFSLKEEQQFADDAKKLMEACAWAGSDFGSISEDAKKELGEAVIRGKAATEKENKRKYLQDQIAKLQTLAAQNDKNETIRWLTRQWTTEGALQKIKEMKLELARMDEHLQLANLDKVMKDASEIEDRKVDLLKLQKEVLESLVSKKQALIPLQVADSLENLATRREIRECNDQLQAITKRFEVLTKEEEQRKMYQGLSRVKIAEMTFRKTLQDLQPTERQQLIRSLFGEE